MNIAKCKQESCLKKDSCLRYLLRNELQSQFIRSTLTKYLCEYYYPSKGKIKTILYESGEPCDNPRCGVTNKPCPQCKRINFEGVVYSPSKGRY